MADFKPAFSDEMIDQLVVDMYEHVKAGTLSKLKDIGVSREMIARRDDDGNLVYYDIRFPGEQREINLNTMIGRVREIRKNWKKYFAPQMEALMLEATYQHALKSAGNVTSFKAAAEMIMPKESADDGDKLTISPRTLAILQQGPVETNIYLGQDTPVEGLGDKGHEGADRVHPVADGRCERPQKEDIPPEVVPSGNGELVHAVHEGGDTTEGSALLDTPVPSEDPVDNDSRDDMGSD